MRSAKSMVPPAVRVKSPDPNTQRPKKLSLTPPTVTAPRIADIHATKTGLTLEQGDVGIDAEWMLR